MGLCKCERKKVTNLFCYEHRINVCEFCMVSSHNRCIVKSYLGWLNDSDFDPSCLICNERFDQSNKDCVRLVCLDVFHWECLNQHVLSAPPTTTPAGFLCPSCDQPIIPHHNHGGPVAEALRVFLNSVEWAKGGHTELKEYSTQNAPIPVRVRGSEFTMDSVSDRPDKLLDPRLDEAARLFLSGQDVSVPDLTNRTVSVESNANVRSVDATVPSLYPGAQRRDSPLATVIPTFALRPDDEDKYHRRVALNRLPRFLRSITSRIPIRLRRRRNVLLLLLCLIVALLLISQLYQSEPDHVDPMFDPHLNPNIHLDHGPPVPVPGVGLEKQGI